MLIALSGRPFHCYQLSPLSQANILFIQSAKRFPPGTYLLKNIEDITRWREDMNFMFEWQEQYLTSERSERVRYCSCHENIKFISSSQPLMFFLLYGD